MKITESLEAEHRILLALFDQVERILPSLASLAEARMLAGVMEGVLKGHAEAETDLAYMALDQALEEKGQLDQLHQEHEEIDASLYRVRRARSLAEAKRLVKTAIAALRRHFLFEERTAFPLIERVLHGDTLTGLGAALKQRRRPVSSPA